MFAAAIGAELRARDARLDAAAFELEPVEQLVVSRIPWRHGISHCIEGYCMVNIVSILCLLSPGRRSGVYRRSPDDSVTRCSFTGGRHQRQPRRGALPRSWHYGD